MASVDPASETLDSTPSQGAAPVRPGMVGVWLAACRPKTLAAALAPILVGTAIAFRDDVHHVGAVVAALVAALLIQVGTNLANDVFDFEKGADTADRLGPVRVTQAGWLSPQRVRRGMLVTFGLALLPGLYLVYLGGWPILLIGVLSIASGIAYTGGPWPLGYNGLGDLFVFIFFGLVATAGTTYVQAGAFSGEALAAGVPLGLLAAAILVVNNLRDVHTDKKVGKRTLAVRFGARFARMEYAVLMGTALVMPLATWIAGMASAWILLTLATAPWVLTGIRRVYRLRGPALNPLLGYTSKVLLLYGILFAVGIAVS